MSEDREFFLVVCCGDRDWTDQDLIHDTLVVLKRAHPDTIILHGDCRGADRLSGATALLLGFPVFACPAPWKTYGTKAGPVRNRWMLRLRPNMVIAFHDNLEASKGTRDMVNAATAAGIVVTRRSHRVSDSLASGVPAVPGEPT